MKKSRGREGGAKGGDRRGLTLALKGDGGGVRAIAEEGEGREAYVILRGGERAIAGEGEGRENGV